MEFRSEDMALVFYELDENHEPQPTTMEKWAEMMHNGPKHVAKEYIGDVYVSTVFTGIDHSYGFGGPPLYFETMIFEGKHDGYQDRCTTWAQALEMHARAVALVRGEHLKIINGGK